MTRGSRIFVSGTGNALLVMTSGRQLQLRFDGCIVLAEGSIGNYGGPNVDYRQCTSDSSTAALRPALCRRFHGV